MLAAVEAWVKRDHDAEWKQWESWLGRISRSVERVPGVTTEVLQPEGLSNHAPRLRIRWDGARLGIAGREVEKLLFEEDPRIVLGGATGDARDDWASTVTIMPYMMMPGDADVVAERLHAVLSKPPRIERAPRTGGEPAAVAGQWEVHVEFFLGSAEHALFFEQRGSDLAGTHRGDILSGDVRGKVEGGAIRFHSSHRYEGTRLTYEFEGKIDGDVMNGTVDLGEYGQARWTARRRQYGQPGGLVRPVKNV